MITTIINYCTIDYKFIKSNINECLKFSDKVIVPVCDHLFNGDPENYQLIEESLDLYNEIPNVYFIQYEWDNNKNAKFHHNMSRWVGLQFVETDYVLFLDADEIPEGDLIKEYLKTEDYKNHHVMALKCYWYFREPIYRAKQTEMAGVLYNRELCTENMVFHKEERWAYRDYRGYLDIREQLTYNNSIMCNHYSWVRSKEEMLKKVQSWAHSTEKNWIQLVEDEFNRDFNGTDFIHGYEFETVENKLQGDIK